MERSPAAPTPLLVHMKKLAASGAYRREQGVYLGDSPKLLAEALKWHAPIREIAITGGTALPSVPAGVRVVEVPEDVMASISPMKSPQGALFTVTLPIGEAPETLPGSRYMVLDGVQDPGNVGTILRTLDAFDFDGLLLLEGCADPWSVKTVRSSMGGGVPPPRMVHEGGGAAGPAGTQRPAPVRYGPAGGYRGCPGRVP